jgi:hypothetical protein
MMIQASAACMVVGEEDADGGELQKDIKQVGVSRPDDMFEK